MVCRCCWPLCLLPTTLALVPQVQFVLPSLDAYEGSDFECGARRCNLFSLGIIRFPTDELFVANVRILEDSNATRGVDFEFYPDAVTWQSGDANSQAILLFIFDDDLAEKMKFLHLGFDVLVPATANNESKMEIFIRDDNDGGNLVITPHFARVTERYGIGECVFYGDRQGGTSGAAGAFVTKANCAGGLPEADSLDLLFFPAKQAQVWADGESGPKCLLMSIHKDDYISSFTEEPMNSSVAKLVIIPDAEREPDEHICLNVSQIAGSTTTLRKDQQQVTFVVTDVDLDATLDLDCTRGFGCQVDLSETWFWEFDLGTVQDASSSNYNVCLAKMSRTRVTPSTLRWLKILLRVKPS